MAELRFLDLPTGDLHRRALDLHLQAAAQRLLHPRPDVRGLGRHQAHRAGQPGQRPGILAGDRRQRPVLHLQVVKTRHLLRVGQVEAGLRVVGVGDGGGADHEVALGLGQLLGDRALLGADELQVGLRQQHVEVALRHPQHQVLCRSVELNLARQRLQLALLVDLAVDRPEQRLGQLHPEPARAEVALPAGKERGPGKLRVEIVVVQVGVGAQLRQQPGATLRDLLLAGQVARARAAVLRVGQPRLLVHRQQVGADGRTGQGEKHEGK